VRLWPPAGPSHAEHLLVAKQKIRRKDLRAPDEFLTLANKTTNWLQQRRRQVTWVAAGIAVVVAGFALNSAFRSARQRDANVDLGRALTAIRGRDFAGATKQLRDAAERWNPSVQGQVATALKASAQLRSGDPDAAIAAVEVAVKDTPDLPPYLHQQLQFAWAVALEQKGQLKEAAEHYETAVALDGPYRGPAVLGAARAHEQLGESERARELYRRYLEEFPEMPDRELIEPKVKS